LDSNPKPSSQMLLHNWIPEHKTRYMACLEASAKL